MRIFNTATETLLWLTECNLATLEELKTLKSSSKTRIARQQEICNSAIASLRHIYGSELHRVAHDQGYPRLRDLLTNIAAKR